MNFYINLIFTKFIMTMNNIFRSIVFVLTISSCFSLVSSAQEIDEIAATISEKLELSEGQTGEMKELMTVYQGELDRTLAKYEGQEEPDAGAMIGEITKIRDEYRGKLGKVLSKEQMNGYVAIIDGVISGMFNDIAEIRLMDLQDPLELSDGQVEKLIPIMGKGMHEIIKVVFENAGTRLSVPKKVSIGNKIKKIQKDTDNGVKSVLTSGQYEKWQAMKEEAQKE